MTQDMQFRAQTAYRTHGFTLLEIIVVLLALSIVAGLTAPIFSQGLTAARITADNLHSQEKLRYAAERMAREIRQINHNGVSYDISSMGISNLVFTNTDTPANTVTLDNAGSVVTLSYSVPALSATLTDEVTVLSFAYYDAAGAVTASPTNVAVVEFILTLQNPGSGGNFTQRTRVALRDQS